MCPRVCFSSLQALCLCAEMFPAGASFHQHRHLGSPQSGGLVGSPAGGRWEIRGARSRHPHRATRRPGWSCVTHSICPHRSAWRQWDQGERQSTQMGGKSTLKFCLALLFILLMIYKNHKKTNNILGLIQLNTFWLAFSAFGWALNPLQTIF